MAKSKSNNNNTKKKVDKPPPLEQYIKPAVAVAVILVLYQFINGILFEKEIQRLDLMDELSLRQVVFGEGITDDGGGAGAGGDDDDDDTTEDSSSITTTPTQSTSTQNFVVLCHPEKATWPISSVFSDAATQIMKKDSSGLAEFRVVDCETPLPGGSGKTLAERFKLNIKTRPTVFVSGKIGQPKQVRFIGLF